MRIAIVSDIHGNLPALEAVLDDLEAQAPDEVWCGGDIGWGGGWASECIARVRKEGWTAVKGNTDVWISGDPQTLESEEARSRHRAIAAAHAIEDEDAEWLLNLPLGHAGPGSILLVHGTPSSPFEAPQPDDPAAAFREYEEQAGIIVYGYVHKAFVRRLADGTLVANSGSVGAPKDGTDACYLIVDRGGPDLILRHRRVPYDRSASIAKARTLDGPLRDLFLENLGAG